LEGNTGERKQDVGELEQELARLIRINKIFLSMVNHEMRTPLTAISGFTELLVASEQLSADARDMVESIKRNSDRLLRLVNDILDVARLESGNLLIVRQRMSLPSSIDASLFAIKHMADIKSIHVRLDVPRVLPQVFADPHRVEQVLTNLLSNAVKYTPQGGRITVRAQRDESADAVIVAVCDTGIGIPEDQLPRIFDRFSQIERAEMPDAVSTGLGLSITKGLVEAQGGRIWAESKVGKGTCVYFALPVASQTILSNEG
jgi:signal transduction histidine kinase